jgi:hypothetical protein
MKINLRGEAQVVVKANYEGKNYSWSRHRDA